MWIYYTFVHGGQAPGKSNLFWMLGVEHFVYFAMGTMQWDIFQEIRPTTICRIELILDKKQAKRQWKIGLSTKKAIIELSSLENPLFDLNY